MFEGALGGLTILGHLVEPVAEISLSIEIPLGRTPDQTPCKP